MNHQLLLLHLKIFQRNLLCDVASLIREQDRLTRMNDQIVKRCESNEVQSILEQVLNQKELLQQEVELLRQELAEIKGRLKIE